MRMAMSVRLPGQRRSRFPRWSWAQRRARTISRRAHGTQAIVVRSPPLPVAPPSPLPPSCCCARRPPDAAAQVPAASAQRSAAGSAAPGSSPVAASTMATASPRGTTCARHGALHADWTDVDPAWLRDHAVAAVREIFEETGVLIADTVTPRRPIDRRCTTRPVTPTPSAGNCSTASPPSPACAHTGGGSCGSTSSSRSCAGSPRAGTKPLRHGVLYGHRAGRGAPAPRA